MRKISLIAILLLCFMTLFACNKDGGTSNTSISFGENGVLTAQASTTEAGTLKIPAPAGTQAQYCIGWYCQSDGATVFLPVGASYAYQAGEFKSFTPLYLHFTTNATTTLDTTVEGGGISFSTEIAKNDWKKLSAITDKISCGTLICSEIDLSQAGIKLTHAELQDTQLPFSDCTTVAWQNETDQSLTFNATLADIAPENRVTPYTAVGYVKIVYSDGSEAYFYANYGEEGAPFASLLSFPETAKQYLHFTTASNAILDLAANGGGIQYISTLPKDEWRALALAAKSITCGTLIYPSAALPTIGGTLTHAALQAAGVTATDVLSSSWLENTEAALSFGATLTGIPQHHRLISYTAVGYIKIVYANDTYSYIYASYKDEIAPSHSVQSLAKAAKSDLSLTQTDYYKYAVGEGDYFSPYNEADRATINELTKLTIGMLVNQTNSPGNYLLNPTYTDAFSARLVRDNDESCAEEWRELYVAIGNTHYDDGGAIVITSLDGTPLSADVITGVIMRNESKSGTIEVNWTKYIFYNGALVVPYSVYTPNV